MNYPPAIKYINKLYKVFWIGLFTWFISLTIVQLLLSRYKNEMLGHKFLFMSTLLFFVTSWMIYNKLKNNYSHNTPYNNATYGAPFYLFISYLIWCFISVFFSMSETTKYTIGYGYLAGYIITFINLGISNKIINMSKYSTTVYYEKTNQLCYIAFLASSIILITLFFNSLHDGSFYSDSRILSNMMPGTIGLLALPVILYPIIFRLTLYRILVIAMAVILIYKGGSRTTVITISTILITALFLKYGRYTLILFLLPVSYLLYDQSLIVFVKEKVLFLDDYYRGLDSLSGRWDLWTTSWRIFQKSPFLGHGFRMSEVMFYHDQDMTSAHNAYLSSLMETGIIGTFFLLAAVLLTLFNLAKTAWYFKSNTYIFYFSLLLGATIFGLGERFIINIGNLTSILCMYTFYLPGIANLKNEICTENTCKTCRYYQMSQAYNYQGKR